MGHMSSATTFEIKSSSPADTLRIAGILGSNLAGGETIELIGDLGAGKTQFVQGLATGLGSQDQVQSPSFTISRIYKGRGDIEIHHYDFHRLDNPGLLRQELAESLAQPKVTVVVEWADTVADILPADKITIHLVPESETERLLKFSGTANSKQLLETLAK